MVDSLRGDNGREVEATRGGQGGQGQGRGGQRRSGPFGGLKKFLKFFKMFFMNVFIVFNELYFNVLMKCLCGLLANSTRICL